MAKETIDPQKMHGPFEVPIEQARSYRKALRALNRAHVPYVVSGAYAMYLVTGLWRNTKDLDIFLCREHVPQALEVLAGVGFKTELSDEKWLAKAKEGEVLIDLIFAAGNMVAEVDREWIERAMPGVVLGVPTHLASPEDLISFKAFICERHRFDGADIAHIIQGVKGQLDWDHLIRRMGEHWELLLWHLVFFRYVYPCHASYVPKRVMASLLARYALLLEEEDHPARGTAFRGTLVSIFSFSKDVADGYRDLRSELKSQAPRAAA